MKKELLLIMGLSITGCASLPSAQPIAVLDDGSTMGEWHVWPEAWGGKAEVAQFPGPRPGSAAIQFTGPGIVYRELPAAAGPEWNQAKGLSFWVKGDGSPLYGTLVVGPAGKGSWEQGFVNAGMTGHAFYFPLADTQWHRVTASWADFIPEGPQPAIGAPGGLVPADIRVIRIGNRWKYWRNYDAYPKFSYGIADTELTAEAPPARPPAAPRPAGDVVARMRRGDPVRILCVGDSITAGAGASADKLYWVLLQAQLRQAFTNDRITVDGWGIGGATLLDTLPWIEWMLGKEPPDLMTLMLGTNDCSAYDPAVFRWCLEQFGDRAARASGGHTAVLPFATLPGLDQYLTKADPYAETVRQLMQTRQQPFLDLSQAFKALPADAYKACFADGVHLNVTGHEFVARTVMQWVNETATAVGAAAAAVSAPPLPDLLKGVRRILFHGDSLTDGSSYPDYVVNTLNGLYPEARFELLNAAGAGDTAANLRQRLTADVLALKPDLVSLCIGTNDCHGRRKTEDYQADIEFLVGELRKAGSRVLLVRPSPFGDAEKEARFQDYLAVLDRVAAANGLPVADAHGLFQAWAKDGREPLGADGIHHGRDGFECMARAVLNGLGLAGVPLDMKIRPWPGLLTAWETADPVPAGTPLDPTAATGWKPYDVAALAARQPWWNSPFPLRGGWMPFDDVNPKQYAYGRTGFDAPTAGDYELQVGGSPNPQVVWVNGVKVWEGRRANGYHPNADRVTVTLRQGRNEIVGVSNFMLFVGVRAVK
ncbi:MAG: GDSL-like Lipase/Acylhydrolase [Lentisphaerae bacterium ADurb.BinA184]|nr:MAG: GDSL-like Lipase/Acylhydrolase [Lentisphaerae bacterium ADurb.BinA184]